jgi:hypothetical protein
MTHDEMIAVIQARKEGKAIEGRQIRSFNVPEWSIWGSYSFNFEMYEYRIKPTPRVRWMIDSTNLERKDTYPIAFFTEAEASNWLSRVDNTAYKLSAIYKVVEEM